MNIKEFNNIFEFSDVLTNSLKEYEETYSEFCNFCKENPNVPTFLCIYEFKDNTGNNYLLNVMQYFGFAKNYHWLFADDRIICTINQDFKIENYSIKKA
jgi:hypothetical protein